MKSCGGVGTYLQEFLNPLSEDGQSASGPGHFTRRETSVTHGTGTELLKQKRSAVGQKNLVLCSCRDLNKTVGLPDHSLVTITEDATQRLVSHV
jgi:hypothetical protein